MNVSKVLGACAAPVLVASCTAPPAPPLAARAAGPQCFLASQVNGFAPVSDTIVDVQVGAGRYYRLSLQGSCPSADWTHRVALRTTSGGSWICQGLDAEVIVPSPAGAERCLVTGIAPIPKEIWLADQHR